MTITTNPDRVEALQRLSDHAFRAIVDADLRRQASEEDAAALRTPELADRWFTALARMAKSVEGQLAAREEDHRGARAQYEKARLRAGGPVRCDSCGRSGADPEDPALRQVEERWLKTCEDYSRTRSKSLRFKSGLEEWLLEARSVRDTARDALYVSVVTEERNRALARVQELEAAIHKHEANVYDPDDPADDDLELWRVLR